MIPRLFLIKDSSAPSWSWASVKQTITYESMAGRQIDTTSVQILHVKILDTKIEIAGSDPHGEIKSGIVTLSGQLVTATPYYSKGRVDGPYLELNGERGLAPSWDDPVFDGKLRADLGDEVHVLKMATTNTENNKYEDELICLVLKCIDEPAKTFKRVGYISRYWPSQQTWFAQSTIDSTLTIV